MKNIGYYNGKTGSIDEMTIPMNDRATYFGDGIYEAAVVRNYKIFGLDDHIDRLYRSAGFLEIEIPINKDEFKALLKDIVSKLDMPEQFVYWQVSRGTAMRSHVFPDKGVPANIYITSKPYKVHADNNMHKIISVEDTRFLHCNIKTLNLLPNIMALEKAKKLGCDEVVFHRNGRVTESSHSNIFIIKDDTIITAPADNLILGGITRAHLIALANEMGMSVAEVPFSLDDLMVADEIFYTSSGSFCNRVNEVDGVAVGCKNPEMFDKIKKALDDKFINETAE